MGKASQSKKVARAARAAPAARPSRRRWLWPGLVALVLVVGLVVIVESRRTSNPAPVQQITNETSSTSTIPVPTSPSESVPAGATATTVPGATQSTVAGSGVPASTSSTVASSTSSTQGP